MKERCKYCQSVITKETKHTKNVCNSKPCIKKYATIRNKKSQQKQAKLCNKDCLNCIHPDCLQY